MDLEHAYVIILMRAYVPPVGRGRGGRGGGSPTASQHNIFGLGKTLTNLPCAPDGVRTSGLCILSPTLNQLSHPVAPCCFGTKASVDLLSCRDAMEGDGD